MITKYCIGGLANYVFSNNSLISLYYKNKFKTDLKFLIRSRDIWINKNIVLDYKIFNNIFKDNLLDAEIHNKSIIEQFKGVDSYQKIIDKRTFFYRNGFYYTHSQNIDLKYENICLLPFEFNFNLTELFIQYFYNIEIILKYYKMYLDIYDFNNLVPIVIRFNKDISKKIDYENIDECFLIIKDMIDKIHQKSSKYILISDFTKLFGCDKTNNILSKYYDNIIIMNQESLTSSDLLVITSLFKKYNFCNTSNQLSNIFQSTFLLLVHYYHILNKRNNIWK